jgi:hypothetical protein
MWDYKRYLNPVPPYDPTYLYYSTTDIGVMGQPRDTFESGYDFNATKQKEAYESPESSIKYGCQRLGMLKGYYNGDMDKATVAYRFGKGAVDIWISEGNWPDMSPYQNVGGGHYYDPVGWRTRIQRNVNDLGSMIEQWEKDNFDLDKAAYTPPPDPNTVYGSGDPVTDSISRFAKTAEMMNRTLVAWFLHNPFLYSGSMTIRGTNEAAIGTYVEDVGDMMSYYVEEVRHEFRVFESYITTLAITRGQFSKEGSFDSRPAELGGPLKGKFYFDDAMQWRPEELEGEATPVSTTTGKQASPLASKGFVPLPMSWNGKDYVGKGYYYYGEKGQKGFGGWYYGTPKTINAVVKAGEEWNRRYPNGPDIGIGDISDEYGKPLVNPKTNQLDHKAHKEGHEVDVRPMRKDKTRAPVMWQHSNEYDRELTKEMLEVLRLNGVAKVTVALFNDKNTDGSQALSGTKQWAKHDNHLHLKFV